MAPYHLSGDAKYSPMLPKEWDGIELDFKLLLKRFKAAQKIFLHVMTPFIKVKIMPEILLLIGTVYWGRVIEEERTMKKRFSEEQIIVF